MYAGTSQSHSGRMTRDGSDDPPPSRQGDVVIDTHVAYFFVPLPDPLWLPDKYVIKVGAPTPLEWMATADTYVPEHTAISLCHHRARVEWQAVQPLDQALWHLATGALPLRGETDEAGLESTGGHESESEGGGVGESAPASADSHDAVVVTIFEVAVGFTPAEGDEISPTILSDAFDRGLAACREVQRAYYLARREPSRLVARESLPMAIPFAVRPLYDVDGSDLPFSVDLGMYLTNANVAASEKAWSAEDDASFREALRHRAARAAFAESLDLAREAEVALYRDGAYSAAVLAAATACETMLDDLLGLMLWEEGRRPEDAAAVFDSFLVARVKREYASRLGGEWSLDRRGVVARWSADVAMLRNRIIHAGYEPTQAEAQGAFDVVSDLQTFLGDRVASRLRTYPRAASFIPGRVGLKRRKRWTRAWEMLTADRTEVNWRDTYARWRLAMRQARPDSPLAVPPELARAAVYAVVHPDGKTAWIAHDEVAGKAAIVPPEGLLGIPELDEQALDAVRAEARAQAAAQRIQFISAKVDPAHEPVWVPEYRLVPGAGVMVTGADLDPLA